EPVGVHAAAPVVVGVVEDGLEERVVVHGKQGARPPKVDLSACPTGPNEQGRPSSCPRRGLPRPRTILPAQPDFPRKRKLWAIRSNVGASAAARLASVVRVRR